MLHRLFEYQCLPMGLSNSSRTFQLLIQSSAGDLMFTIMADYLDDSLVYSENFEQHLKRLEKVLQRLCILCLKLNLTYVSTLQEQG